MADQPKTKQGSRSEDRRRRQAAALRENLGKRKEQARARAAAGKPQSRGDNEPAEAS
jgi:hypothetical protein